MNIRRLGFALVAANLLLVGGAGSMVTAQVAPAQLEVLRNLTPADRAALLDQLGLDSSISSAVDGQPADREVQVGASRKTASDTWLARADVLSPGDSVLITVDFIRDKPARVIPAGETGMTAVQPAEPAPEYLPEERRRLSSVIDMVRQGNPYVLDREGALIISGLAPIALGGLTEAQASARLVVESTLTKLEVRVTRLPVARLGLDGLKPFGYDFFDAGASTFARSTDVPVPADYVVGAGDQLIIQYFGSQNRTLRLVVSRDGVVTLPEIGPVEVAGRSFNEVRQDIESRIARQTIGVRATVGMGEARSISIFVVGESNNPGVYIVSGLSTITGALYASGGIKRTGSLRDIQLKRQGSVIRRLDLYDLLLRGDTRNDAALLPGDVILIPAVGDTASVEGEVNRPAIYEIKGRQTIEDLVVVAGGLAPDGDRRSLSVIRQGDDGFRRAESLSLVDGTAARVIARRNDRVRVSRLSPSLEAGVAIEGHVHNPGVVAWREGLRLSDVIRSVADLKPGADLNYVVVRRERPPSRKIEVLSADIVAALRSPGSNEDLLLSSKDRIVVLETSPGRRNVVDSLLNELRKQSGLLAPSGVVSVGGRTRAPGDYPLEPDMRVSDLIRAGGGLDDAAFGSTAELSRYSSNGSERISELLTIDLAAVLRGDAAADVVLQAFDVLTIKELPEWSRLERVIVSGEVRFPGTYPIRRGETLRSLLERAGGLTALAFPSGAVFTRTELLEREQKQIEQLSVRLQAELAAASIQQSRLVTSAQGAGLVAAQGLLGQLKTTQPTGRLVVDLDAVLASRVGGVADVALRDGDQILIPKLRQEVSVIGEVQNSTSHLFRSGLIASDYLALSGGTTQRADSKRIYIVRANGSVVSYSGRGWTRSNTTNVLPGDTIVVPIDVERLPALPLWQAVTSIIYNAAIAVAALSSL